MQKTNALNYLLAWHELFESDKEKTPQKNRKSILEPLLLQVIASEPQRSKADLTEIIYADRVGQKSSLDRPLKNLLAREFIRSEINEKAVVQAGDGRTYYSVTQKGLDFIEKGLI